ncbi:MAG: hypothetical protein WCK90_00330 [archaeon]
MRNNLKSSLIITIFFTFVIASGLVSAVLISDQGTDLRTKSGGQLLDIGNLTITIWDSAEDGNLIYNQTFPDAIVNGSWNIMISPALEYGNTYWKDYQVNEQDLNFDGNNRTAFQSSVGLINNVSYINFSLINSCPVGSSIRLIYENGSVECQTDSSGLASVDLTNYSLKNQSEIFDGNITTVQTGFFGWLGDFVQRITKLFVQDIDASGNVDVGNNVNVTGNVTASYFIGNGALLTNLPLGSETDPIFISENSTLWNAISNKLAETDQRYNDTLLILSVNTTSNIMSLSFYNKSEVDALISTSGNSSWNKSSADSLYYPITNPSGYYNSTNPGSTYNASYAIWAYNQTYSGSTYNSTYDTKAGTGNCPAGQVVQNTTTGGVQCVSVTEADTLQTVTNRGNSTSILSFFNSGIFIENATIEGQLNSSMIQEREIHANTAGNSLTISAGGASVGSQDKAGGNLILKSGVSTGFSGGNIQLLTRSLLTTGGITGDVGSTTTSSSGFVAGQEYNVTNVTGNGKGATIIVDTVSGGYIVKKHAGIPGTGYMMGNSVSIIGSSTASRFTLNKIGGTEDNNQTLGLFVNSGGTVSINPPNGTSTATALLYISDFTGSTGLGVTDAINYLNNAGVSKFKVSPYGTLYSSGLEVGDYINLYASGNNVFNLL